MDPEQSCQWQVLYQGELLGITDTAGRHELLHQAIEQGRIQLPFRTYKLEFRLVPGTERAV